MQGIKKIGVISFLVIYLLLALTYVHLLPNYNQLLNNGYYSGTRHLTIKASTNIESAGRHALVQKLFYATAENKRQLLPALLFAGMVLTTLLVVASIGRFGLIPMPGNPAASAFLHRHAYLQYRSLRL